MWHTRQRSLLTRLLRVNSCRCSWSSRGHPIQLQHGGRRHIDDDGDADPGAAHRDGRVNMCERLENLVRTQGFGVEEGRLRGVQLYV